MPLPIWPKNHQQFLSISYNLAYRIKNLWTVFINFLQPYLLHQKISAVCINFLQHYLPDRENLNSFYQFLTALLDQKALNSFYQFLTTLLIRPKNLNSCINFLQPYLPGTYHYTKHQHLLSISDKLSYQLPEA